MKVFVLFKIDDNNAWHARGVYDTAEGAVEAAAYTLGLLIGVEAEVLEFEMNAPPNSLSTMTRSKD